MSYNPSLQPVLTTCLKTHPELFDNAASVDTVKSSREQYGRIEIEREDGVELSETRIEVRQRSRISGGRSSRGVDG